ncbi:MAG TPA: hypothetical protein VFY10_13940 [Dehalococcoidia bacterium]|nr:hypothetical protein [Dehalococcoidia bacterium]
MAAIAPDGRCAYVTTDGPGMTEHFGCKELCTRLNLVDLANGHVLAEMLLDKNLGVASLTPRR